MKRKGRKGILNKEPQRARRTRRIFNKEPRCVVGAKQPGKFILGPQTGRFPAASPLLNISIKKALKMRNKLVLFIVLFLLTACGHMEPIQKSTTIPSAAIISIPSLTPRPIRTAGPGLSTPASPPSVFGIGPETIKDYLATKVSSSAFGGKVFCAYKILDSSESAAISAIYLWAQCQEYYGEKSLNQGTGVSLPVALYLQKVEQTFVISSHKIPGDGTKYVIDIKALFPESTWGSIFGRNAAAYNQRAQVLEYETENDAIAYYGLNNSPAAHPTYTPLP